MKVLVTGANGFVGRHLLSSLPQSGHEVVAFARADASIPEGVEHRIGDSESNFGDSLNGIDAVVHTAGFAHRTSGSPEELREQFEGINRDWTGRIARAVAESDAGVLIHISSIAATGSAPDRRSAGIREEDEVSGITDYGRSKREADALVLDTISGTGKAAVNLRPPLIYGAGARGNWRSLLKLAALPVPLPFGAVRNRRSYLGVGNLCELIGLILDHAGDPVVSGTYHVADREVLSLREVVTAVCRGLGKSPLLFPVPPELMEMPLRAVGKTAMSDGLFRDLVVDCEKVKRVFSWEPSVSTFDGMAGASTPGASTPERREERGEQNL